ncbi:DUF2971 domain-containing protein [Parasedimentitalea maritima]|uniref:DUF2971 domain-containing protein n=1 Tax=Parasedimentitalea maritima TaxID=2578117 RepID=A0ABY2UXU1_9RHOB|nr:DUF2971 domain-containing protein [Zongyanglinia marina]TLP67692.1 DUF2971 domain-containing protein [Zongyanglinia marina]
MNDQEIKIREVFFPFLARQLDKITDESTDFVHYTSAEASLSIIQKQEVWMRSAVVMNDFSEVQHGQNCLTAAWNQSELGGRIRAVLDRCQEGLSAVFEKTMNERLDEQFTQSYIISISEHGDSEGLENKFGRLSMWRAYGGNTNVAFVFNNAPFISDSNALNAFTSPVLYTSPEGFLDYFREVVEGLENNFDLLTELGPELVSQTLFSAFHFSILSAKHPGFSEEREWRVLHCPTLWPSDRLQSHIQCISGVPQKIFKLKLEDYPDEGFVGATLPELIKEIIIGPTQDPYPIYDALAFELQKAGVDDAYAKIRISDIPLRR